MEVYHGKSLKELNTFGVSAKAKYFVEVNSVEDFTELTQTSEFQNEEKLILGGGSNILFTKDFDGLIIKNNLLGKSVICETDDTVTVEIASGENWHEAVLWATENGWSGIENLALIPGSVGATPVQNIGAYGVEIKETLQSVQVVDMQTGEPTEFSAEACKFGYRDSIFKNEAKGKYFITGVTLQLQRQHTLRTEYGAISAQLDEMNIENPGVQDVQDAVIAIRQSKLPDPKQIGNAGSFFKNPVVPHDQFQKLQDEYPDMPNYPQDNGVKIPAGWLIEQCGWKGKRVGNVGVHDKQALVLVNYGSGTGQEIKQLAEAIQFSIHEKFGIALVPEVTMI